MGAARQTDDCRGAGYSGWRGASLGRDLSIPELVTAVAGRGGLWLMSDGRGNNRAGTVL